ncbi:hypothetical protein ISF6_3226 [Piscinibacter sakaiensis]|uniref:Uncharacterized protein n=1 Tax=Piscinibacter sakaiensis TaxID=1547922 RepID=A0A0K8P444_PISS1|nr:hypothetical protein ISF6_3226 [Piscinibacter sakaiensis]
MLLTYDHRRRGELPVPIGVRVGDLVPVNGKTYRVREIRT